MVSSRLKYAIRFGKLRSLARDDDRSDFLGNSEEEGVPEPVEVSTEFMPEVNPEGGLLSEYPLAKPDVIPDDIPDDIPGAIPEVIPVDLLSPPWDFHSRTNELRFLRSLAVSGPRTPPLLLSPSVSLSNCLSRSVLNITDILWWPKVSLEFCLQKWRSNFYIFGARTSKSCKEIY